MVNSLSNHAKLNLNVQLFILKESCFHSIKVSLTVNSNLFHHTKKKDVTPINLSKKIRKNKIFKTEIITHFAHRKLYTK